MNEDPQPSAPVGPPFKDRRTGLLVFGILQILFGAMAALIVPLMFLGSIMGAPGAAPPRQMVPGAVFYGVIAATLITLGIGSLQARRWARALSLIVAWSWLLIGVASLIGMSLFLPSVLNAPPVPGRAMPPGAAVVAMVAALLITGIMFVVVPTVLVVFYQSRHVKATCNAHDPEPRWTDACPLPVLALSLWLGFTALSLLTMPWAMNGVLPVFGTLLSGWAGLVCCVGLAGLLGYAAWACYRLRPLGWWIVVGGLCLGTASTLITFTRIDLWELYRAMGYSETQLDMMRQFTFLEGNRIAYLSLVGVIPVLGFLLFVKRYFRPTPRPFGGSGDGRGTEPAAS